MTASKKNGADQRQEPAAEWVALSELNGWAKNPRKNDAAVERVAESIRRFGFGAPIVARRENKQVIAGHTRLKAAKLLGLKTVPVRLLDLDERQAELLALADNKLGEIAEWDEQQVNTILADLTIGEAALAGWAASDLGALLDAPSPGDSDAAAQLGHGLKYSVVAECADETQQGELLERLEAEGFTCKPLIS